MATTEKLYTIGSEGDDILDLQALLGVTESGVYDDATKNAVTKYQTQNGLTVDGIVGDETLTSLLGNGVQLSGKEISGSGLSPLPTQPIATTNPNEKATISSTPAASTNTATTTAASSGTTVPPSAFTLPGLSEQTRAALEDMITNGYTPSAAVNAALQELNDILENEPAEFSSQWSSQIDAIMEQITNREDFSYDYSTDATYNTYRDLYQRQGRMSMMDTVGQSSALTGGYGNSWAQTAGQQSYNQNLQNLNNIVPQLQEQALNQYNAEGQRLQDAYSLASNERSQDLTEYQQGYNEWAANRDFAQNSYDSSKQYDYNDYQSRLDYYQNLATQENSAYNTNRQYAYETAMNLLQLGKMPSAAMLEAAGISAADAKKFYKSYKKSSSSGSSRSSGSYTPTPTTTPKPGTTPTTLRGDAARSARSTAANLYSNYVKTGRGPDWSKYSDAVRAEYRKLSSITK